MSAERCRIEYDLYGDSGLEKVSARGRAGIGSVRS